MTTVLLAVNIVLLLYAIGILRSREHYFREFMVMLHDIEVQHQQVSAIREDWERRGEGRIEDEL